MKFRKGRFVFNVALIIALAAAFPLWRQQAQNRKQQIAKTIQRVAVTGAQSLDNAPAEGYVIVRSEHGTECRQMTARESRELRANERLVEMRTIDSGAPARTLQGFKITLRGTTQLDGSPAAKQAFQRAAAKWESILQSPITIIVDVDFGPNRFGTPFPSANVIGATSEAILSIPSGYNVVREALVEDATTPAQTAAFNALPANTIPTEFGPSPGIRATQTQFRGLGFLDPVANPTLETGTIGPPPAIGFNSAIPFDFDPSDGIDADKIDFEATAVHEIGHALGFVSNVGLREVLPTFPGLPSLWDLFRFRAGGLALSSINSQQRLLLTGGAQSYFGGDGELGLSTGDPTGANGDRRQASHWRDDILTGQYVGIMDPTASDGQPDTITAGDLFALNLFGFRINPDATVYEIPSIDDNTREEIITLTNAIAVNRFTPSRYPSTVQGVRMMIPPGVGAGQSLRVVAFIDANRTGAPPANPAFIADRTLTLPNIPANRFLDITFPTPPAINAGDLYIGVQSASALIAVDSNGRQQRRSFLSTNNGASFQALQNSANAPVNFIARPLLTNKFGVTPTPALDALSPSATAPAGAEFTLYVQGSGFRQNSTVRWNNVDRPTTFASGAELRAQIPATDIAAAGTAKVTVFTPGPGGGESAASNFSITGDAPAPTIARLSPNAAAAGAPSVNLNVFGANFTTQSVVRFNGNNLTTARTSSVQLTAQVPGTAIAGAGDNRVSVTTPGPGGGTTSELTFTVTACSFTLSEATQSGTSFGGESGTVLRTSSPCAWTAAADQPWINLTNPLSGNGTGQYVLNFRIDPNTTANARSAKLTIGGQMLTLNQFGRATGVPAASFLGSTLAPEAIVALFGAGLATETRVADTQPLPTELAGTRVVVVDARGTSRFAPLFFVSPGQINFLIPAGSANGTATAQVLVSNPVPVADGRVMIAASAPGLFAANANGQGVAAAVALRVKADNSQVFEAVARFDSAQNKFVPIPIDLGPETEKVFLILYGSGIRGRTALSAVSLRLGDVTVPVSFAGAVPGLTGLDQINAELPRTLIGKGEVSTTLTIDSRTANAVMANIK